MFFKSRKLLLIRFALVLVLLSGLVGIVPIQTAHAATLIVMNTNDIGSGMKHCVVGELFVVLKI